MSAKPTRRHVLAAAGLSAAGAMAGRRGSRLDGTARRRTDSSGQRHRERIFRDAGGTGFISRAAQFLAESSRQAVHRFLDVEPDSLVDRLHQWRVRAAVYGGWAADEELHSMMSLALSHREFSRRYPDSPPLIVRSPSGWEVRASTKNPDKKHHQSESHKDQLLAACGEIGVPAGQAIETDSGRISILDLIESSRRDFFLDQEAAWSVVAYCVYLPETPTWKNRFGEEMTYDAIARSMIESELGAGAVRGPILNMPSRSCFVTMDSMNSYPVGPGVRWKPFWEKRWKCSRPLNSPTVPGISTGPSQRGRVRRGWPRSTG